MVKLPDIKVLIREILIDEFVTEEKVNEFLKVCETVRTSTKKQFTKTMTNFNEQWQKEKKQVVGNRERQTD